MNIKNDPDSSVQVISRGPGKAEVIVTMPGVGKSKVRVTRHILCRSGIWTDSLGNYYTE